MSVEVKDIIIGEGKPKVCVPVVEDNDNEVKKNALIALYNLIGREILDEVANGQNFSDDLKMEAVSMISEYEDEVND